MGDLTRLQINQKRQVDLQKQEALKVNFEAFKRKLSEIEADINSFWSPHKGQVPVARALFREFKRYVFLQCGRKFGKTEFAIYCMYVWAILFPNSQVYYIADTMKHAGEILWKNGRLPDFFKTPKRLRGESQEEFAARKKLGQMLHNKYVESANNSEMRVHFKNGSFIKVDGAENYANADGIEPDFMVYDEFKSHNFRYHEAAEPNLRVKKAPLLIVGTPPEELGTYYEKIARTFDKLTYASFFKRPSYLNDKMYPAGRQDPDFIEECEKYIARGDEDVMQRELFAEIVVSGSKAIFPVLKVPEYDHEHEKYIGHTVHVRPHQELQDMVSRHPKDYEYQSVFDPGSASCFANLIGVMNKHSKVVMLMDEIYETDQRETSTGIIWPRSQEKCEAVQMYMPYWDYTYDNAATWFATEVLDRYGEALTPCSKDIASKSVDKKQAKLGMIKDMLLEGKLLISDRCVKMIWEMTQYRKDENGKIPKENDHLIDCLRYMLSALHYDPSWVEKKKPVEDTRRGLTIEDDLRESRRENQLYLPEIYDE